MKIAMLRLRNRVLNRFKALKRKQTVTTSKIITKNIRNSLGLMVVKKVLRVVPKSVLRKSTRPTSGKTSPQKNIKPTSSVSRLSRRFAGILYGQNRVHLRNRRLMGSPKIHSLVGVCA